MADAPSPPRSRIAVLSFLVLVLELALIRQVPAEVRAISFFTNLLLMASFFGLGVGCIRQDQRSLAWTVPVGLAAIGTFVWCARGITTTEAADAVHFWLYAEPGRTVRIPLFLAAILSFFVGALPFVGLGQALASTMDRHPRLSAYAWDIAGSLLGTVLFAVSAALSTPPWAWMPVVSVLWAALFAVRLRVLHALPGFAFLLFAYTELPSRWSPYYFVQHEQAEDGLRVFVNSNFHQRAVDFDTKDPRLEGLARDLERKFGVPYEEYRIAHGRGPRSVLVLGAGTGNDVAIALRNGVEQVVAVEIDPAIIALGRTLSPLRPYDSERVTLIEDDARHFLWNTDQRFDLVVFGTLDSLTLLSGYANLRLENYVYTKEAFEDAAKILAPDGMVVAYYSVARDWLYPRMYSTARAAFGPDTRLLQMDDRFLFNTILLGGPGARAVPDDPARAAALAGAIVSTDDWPYVYLERPTIAPIYLAVGLCVSICAAWAFAMMQGIQRGPAKPHLEFLFLGMGFSLLESASIVRLMLAFGSTWVVNPIVFASVLAMIWVANVLVATRRAPPLPWAWAGLFAALIVDGWIPTHALVALDFPLRALAAGAMVGVPVFFAATCFSHLFGAQERTGYPLGVNLVGVMLGGLLEYLSMWTGMRAMWLVLIVVYALAFAAHRFAAVRGPAVQ